MTTLLIANTEQILPQEICGLICHEPAITRGDLHALCGVSHTFRDEAERILYTSARLKGLRKIRSFCTSVIRRPHLAARLRLFEVSLPPQMDMEANDLSRITNTLRLCINITHLSILQDKSQSKPGRFGDAVQRWILEGHSFRLKFFMNSYFQPQVLLRFLTEQSEIECLSIHCKAEADLWSAPLPKLRSLDISSAAVQEFGRHGWNDRNFEHLQFSFIKATDSEELATFAALTRFRTTLKSLSIIRIDGTNGLDITVLVACVAAQLPNIKYLQILDFTIKSETVYVPFLPFHLAFTQIQTLAIRPPTILGPTDADLMNIESAYRELRTQTGRRGAAERVMTSLPMLKELQIVDKEVCKYTKDADSVFTERVSTGLDMSTWKNIA